MQELKFVWLRAIALAWKDSAFKVKLLEEPRAALRAFLGVVVPEEVELRVREGSRGAEPEVGGRLLDIILPPPPDESLLQVVALADYAQAAMAKPPCTFTQMCCNC